MNREGHAVALITGDSTTDQRIAVLNRCVCVRSGKGRRDRRRESGREGGKESYYLIVQVSDCDFLQVS